MPKRKVIVYGLLMFVVSLIIIVIMAAPSRNILSTIRSGSDDEQIQSLSSRINEVSGNEKFWHDAYLWFIGTAILVSVVLFFVQHHEASLAKERADAESELNRVKDRKLTREISAADERAGKANERAAALESETAQSRVLIANAQADAARATERAALAESHLAESNAQAKLAEQHAKEADVKAESFRLDIAKANESAKQAESRTAAAELELARLKSPRFLTNIPELVGILKQFSGTEFRFQSVFADEESFQFLKQIDGVLAQAGWKRVKQERLRLGITAFKISGDNDLVEADISTGLNVDAESTEPFEKLQQLPQSTFPPHIKAALLLSELLRLHISPPELTRPSNVGIDTGESTVIRIRVGKKP